MSNDNLSIRGLIKPLISRVALLTGLPKTSIAPHLYFPETFGSMVQLVRRFAV